MAVIRNSVIGRRIDKNKKVAARQLRRHMTEAETILWSCLRANRLGGLQFRRQHVIAGYIVDFYCHAAALIVEADGSIHAEQRESDSQRDCALTRLGYRVLRFTNDEIETDLNYVLGRILSVCREAASGTTQTVHGCGE